MKKIVILIIALAFQTFSQSILQTYFAGDTTKMIEEANKMLLVPDPFFDTPPVVENSPSDKNIMYSTKLFTMRDSSLIHSYVLNNGSSAILLYIHGVKSSGAKYLESSQMLSEKLNATVYVLDLRGHGLSEGKRGDVDYITQYTDDIYDVVKIIKKENPNKDIVVASHSMGGGIALRYAITYNSEFVKSYVFLAPLIGHDSPAFRTAEASSSSQGEEAMKINIPKIIGIKMLNELGNHALDSSRVLFFNASESLIPNKYTFRANMSMAPDSYLQALSALNKPFITIIGDNDEAFVGSKLQEAFSKNSYGETIIIEGANHTSVLTDKRTFNFVKESLSRK